jgi:hypothetical protein
LENNIAFNQKGFDKDKILKMINENKIERERKLGRRFFN